MFFFVLAVFSAETLLSVYTPFTRTAPRELGEWTLRGQAVAQKRVIHLTSGIPNVTGGMCARLPTDALEFDVNIDILFSADTFVLTFSKNLCPDVSSYFNGMNVSFTPVNSNNDLKIRLTGSEIFPNKEQIIENFNFSQKHVIFIHKTSDKLAISISDVPMQPIEISLSISRLYQYCYFSLFAFSPSSCDDQCVTNVYKFDYMPRSLVRESDKNLSIKNRKALKSSQDTRQIMKMNRRAQMEKVAYYIDLSLSKNDTFTPEQKQKLSDAFVEIKEMKKRAESGISANDLNILLETKVKPVLDKAAARYEKVALALFHSKNEMISLWKQAGNQLKSMRAEINNECAIVENEARKTMMQLKEKNVLNIGKDPKVEQHGFTYLLHVICIIEFICFVVFFISKHKKLGNKKRY